MTRVIMLLGHDFLEPIIDFRVHREASSLQMQVIVLLFIVGLGAMTISQKKLIITVLKYDE